MVMKGSAEVGAPAERGSWEMAGGGRRGTDDCGEAD